MFSDLWNKIKEIVRSMLPKKSIETVLHVTPIVSDKMANAIQLWSDMYEGNSPWLKEPTYSDPTRITSLGLPSLIASEKARMVTLEMTSEISAPMEVVEAPVQTGNNLPIDDNTTFAQTGHETKPISSTARAEFLNSQYQRVLKQIRRQLEYGIAKGGLVIKPYIVMHDTSNTNTDNTEINKIKTGDEKTTQSINTSTTVNVNEQNKISRAAIEYDAEIEFDFIQADRFFPLAFDANGKVIEAAFIQTKADKAKEKVYIRLEYHKLDGRTVTVQNLAFESTDMGLANSNNLKSATNLGSPIPLTNVPEWANLQPTTVINNVDRLLFAYFKMPEANIVDPYSPLGVSGYCRVVNLIKDADMQYSRLLWEFEGGELAIDVDRNALDFMEYPTGETSSVLPIGQKRLFRKVDLNTEDTYNVFAPQLRDDSLIRGLNMILMRIEDATGLARGTFSEVTSQEAKTATELKILKQRSFATNADIQMALQDALEDMVYVMDVYCTLYEVTEDGEYDISFEWDDSIIIDSESELSKRITLMQNGLASKLETRMWYFGETENQARLALQLVDEESMRAVAQNIQAEQYGADNDSEQEEDTKSPADTTSQKISKGKQADSLDNPNKSKTADNLKK